MPRKRDPNAIRRPPGRPAIYPWDTWFNGDTHALIPRTDFNCTRESLRQQIYAQARERGLKVIEVIGRPGVRASGTSGAGAPGQKRTRLAYDEKTRGGLPFGVRRVRWGEDGQ